MNTISTKLQLIMTLMQGNCSFAFNGAGLNGEELQINEVLITDNDSKVSIVCTQNEYAAVEASLTLFRFASENVKGNKIRKINTALSCHFEIKVNTKKTDYKDNSNY